MSIVARLSAGANPGLYDAHEGTVSRTLGDRSEAELLAFSWLVIHLDTA